MKLLLSVVSETEVAPAVEGGADIIDIKNPHEGSLGASFPHVIRRVRELTPPELPVSAAIGDVPNLPGTVALAALGASVCGIQYVKVGLFGVQDPHDAVSLLQAVRRSVNEHDPSVMVIAAGYADADKINSLSPLDLPGVAIAAGVNGCLLDTALKKEGSLLTNFGDIQLKDFVTQCQRANLLCALAGSLDETNIPHVCKFGADIIGVRTAACHGDRVNGRVDRQKVRQLKEMIALNASPSYDPCPAAPSPDRAFPRL